MIMELISPIIGHNRSSLTVPNGIICVGVSSSSELSHETKGAPFSKVRRGLWRDVGQGLLWKIVTLRVVGRARRASASSPW